MRYVIDTNVVVAALRSPKGASAEFLRRVRLGDVIMLVSVPLFAEYEAVATRSEHLEAAGATRAEIENVLDVLARFAEPVEIHYLWRPRLRDPDDDMVLEVAVNGRAEAIVTFNRGDFGAVPSQFGIEVLNPGEALRRA
jgi:putative PIN family toxin of toxin-antitoxin system